MSIFWLTLTSLALTSLAFDIVVINESDKVVNIYVQSLGSQDGAPDQEGFLRPGKERVFDNANPWLSHSSMGVKEGDTRSVSIYDPFEEAQHSCGDILFKGGTVITYKDKKCTTAKMPLVSNTQTYIQDEPRNFHGWIVKEFDLPTRVYATGPTKLEWIGSYSGSTNMTYSAVRHGSKVLTDIIIKAYISDTCRSSTYMNDASGCQVAGSKFHVEYVANFNPGLPAGDYSGVAKIFSRKWHGGEESTTYVNIEISKSRSEEK